MTPDSRARIHQMIKSNELKSILNFAGEIHGHFCPGVALGVRAGYLALKSLGVVENLGMEKMLAIVECNNCFVDGIQVSTGCTLGNNALIYKDYGKNAVTLILRESNKGIRIAALPSKNRKKTDLDIEAVNLRDKVVKRREGTPEDEKQLTKLWKKRSFAMLELSDKELFKVTPVIPELPAFAPLHDSQTCSKCGEEVMETRARFLKGKPVCLPCSGMDFFILEGSGIRTSRGVENR